MEPARTPDELAALRAELTVDEAWAVAIETEKMQVAIREVMAVKARVEDAATAGETAGAVAAEIEVWNFTVRDLLKEIDRADWAVKSIEASALQRRRHEAHG